MFDNVIAVSYTQSIESTRNGTKDQFRIDYIWLGASVDCNMHAGCTTFRRAVIPCSERAVDMLWTCCDCQRWSKDVARTGPERQYLTAGQEQGR